MFNKKYKNESIAFPINELLADRSRYQSNRKTPSQAQFNFSNVERYFTDSEIKKQMHIKTNPNTDNYCSQDVFMTSAFQTQRENLSQQHIDKIIVDPSIKQDTVGNQSKILSKQRSSSNKYNEQTLTSVSKKSTQATFHQRKIMSAKLSISPKISLTQDQINKMRQRRQTTLNLQTFVEEKLTNNNNYNYDVDLKILDNDFKKTLEIQQILIDESTKNQKKKQTNTKNDDSLTESNWETAIFLLTKTLQEVENEHLFPYLNDLRSQNNGQTSMISKDNCINQILNTLNSSVRQIITQVSKNSEQLTILFSNIWRTFTYVVDIILQKCDQERSYAIESHFKHVQEELEEKKKENTKILNDYYNIHEQYLILQKETQTNTTILQAKLHTLKTEFDEYIYQQEEIANLDYATGVMKEMGLQIKGITQTIKKIEEGIQERDQAINKSLKGVVESYRKQKMLNQ